MKEIGHNPWCNCFECEPNHVDALLSQKSTDPYIGKIWRAKNYAIKNYSQADINSRQFTGYKKGEVIGKFIGKKNNSFRNFLPNSCRVYRV